MELRLSLLMMLYVISTAAVYSNQRLIDKLAGIISLKRIKRQGVQCDSTVELIGCDLDHPLSFSRREENRFRARYIPDPNCDIVQTVFDWYIYFANNTDLQLENYPYRDILIIKPYTMGSGDHAVNVYVKEIHRDSSETNAASDPCTFSIRPELPIPQITGGLEITASSGEDFKVSGKESIDVNVAPGQPGNLIFKWTCTVTGSTSDFCNQDLGGKPFITIPASKANHGSIYIIILSVKAPETDWEGTQQIVHFKSNAVEIKIVCLKNCPPVSQKTNSKKYVILQAVCVKNCESLNMNRYEWSINVPDFDYDANTRSGRNTDIFHINENILQAGSKYIVSVALQGVPGGSSVEINVHVPPELGPCNITPQSGEALKTKFRVKCQFSPGDYMFEIYSTQNNIEVIVEKGIILEELLFSLGPGSKVKVRMLDSYRFFDEKLLDVTVTSLLQTTGSDEDLEKNIWNEYFDINSEFSIEKLMEEKNFEKVLTVTSSLADEMGKLLQSGKTAIAKKYTSTILNLMSKTPMDTEMRARQLGALAAKITESFSSKPDPDVTALGTRICKNSANKMLKELKTKRFPDSFSEEMKESAKTLAICSQAGVEPNFDILQPEVPVADISTPFPVLDMPAIVEDYPTYVDDQNSSKAMNKFDESSSNLIKICFISSKKMAVKMSVQEETKFVQLKFFNLTSTLKTGKELVRTTIESQGVRLIPSADFAKSTSPVHVAMCTSIKNIFWWIQEKEIFTSIAIIDFSVYKKSVTTFNKPFLLSFETKSNILSKIKIYEDTTPRNPERNVSDVEFDFEKMSVHRINAFKWQSFLIEFEDLNGDDTLDVVIADFYKPTLEEFKKKSVEIDRNNFKLYISNKKNYDSWYYLVVLPNSKMGKENIKYKFSVYTLSCFRWSEQETKWKLACVSTRDSTKWLIKCECYHSSALAAMLINNEVRLEQTLIEEFELETQTSYIILISVATVFLLYCILFTWFSVYAVDKVVKRTMYFLGDVPNSYRYGYVLIVKTGNKSHAGTTSNVTIKIYGTKSESKEHVLNYPDPEKKLLQKNGEDSFFIGTEFYLGDIEKIDLWFDSIGYRPAWFCSEVEIFDTQKNNYWLFEINKWFEILRKEQIVYTAFPTKPSNIENKTYKKIVNLGLLRRISNSFRGPHMWNFIRSEEQALSRMKRLHIIFSIFLTMYIMGVYLNGCPKLKNSDSLSYTLDYKIDKHVVFNTMACFAITFVIHFPIVWFFRYPKNNVLGQKVLKQYPLSTNSLCWFFLVVNIIISMTLLIILGFWVPHIIGLLWLTSVVVGLLVYIFIIENVIRLIINFTTNQQTRIQQIFKQIKSSIVAVERQRAMLYKKFGTVILRPYFGHLYKPLDDHKIKKQKYWAEIKERLWEILEDLVMITIYVTLLYLVIVMDRDVMSYLSHIEMRDLIRGVHSRTILFEEVFHRKELEDYIENTLIFSMQDLQWYGKYVTINPGMTIDNANKYLGIARLRQHRTYNTSCMVDFFNQSSCHPSYFWHSETSNFSEGWMADKFSNKFARMDHVWDYVGAWHAGSINYAGTFAIYPGGGYIATLGRTMVNSIINLSYLLRNNWIDSLSRCLFIEFLLYNPCTNLFNSVRIKFEISTTGYIQKELSIHTAKLLFVKEETGVLVWMILLSFIVMLTILIIKLTHRLIRKRKLLLKDIWHIVDIFIVVMSLVCLGLYVARSEVVNIFLSRLEKARNNEFINYFHLMYTERTLTIVAAVLVFLATLRLWKLMRFLVIVKVVEKTLLFSAAALICLFLYQLIFVLACTFYGVFKYGDRSRDFRNIVNTIPNLFIISLNFYKDFDFEALKGGMGYIYYSMFMFVTLGIYTVYIAVITISYANAQFYYSNEGEYNVVNYVKEQCEYYIEMLKIKCKNFRLRGGKGKYLTDRKVFPKADEFRYADCITIPSNRMDGMTFVAKCTVRNMRRRKLGISDKDADLIKHTIVNLFREDTEEKEIFFTSNVAGERMKLVDDNVMLRMERIVETLLVTDNERLKRLLRDRRRKLYRKIVESHEQKMKDMADNVNVLLNLVNVVNINV